MKNTIKTLAFLLLVAISQSIFANSRLTGVIESNGSLIAHADVINKKDGKKSSSLISLKSNDGILISENSGFTEASYFGFCYDPYSSSCEREVKSFDSAMTQSLRVHLGNITPDFLAPSGLGSLICNTTHSLEADVLRARVKCEIEEMQGFSIFDHEYIIDLKSSEKFNNLELFVSDSVITPCRKPLYEVENATVIGLSESIFKITSDIMEDNGLELSSAEHGTGFYISENGYFLTNKHVISLNPLCLKKGQCDINISHSNPDGTITTSKRSVILQTCDAKLDFCLIKIQNMEKNVTPVKLSEIGETKTSKVYTIGFPGDKEIESEEGTIHEITYSSGELIGLAGNSLVTTAAINGGASGSPFFSAKTNTVVGLVSNGTGNPLEDGSLISIVRPLSTIRAEYKIDEYLSGKMEKNVSTIMQNIRESNNIEYVSKNLKEYNKLRTFLGVNSLKHLMITHNDSNIRELILSELEILDVVKF